MGGRRHDALHLGVEPKEAVMQTDPSHSPSAQVEGGSVVGLWRYPVKSMLGEELNASEITECVLVGDRQFAIVDAVTGKVAGAKNPHKWGNFFDFRAAYVEPPRAGSKLPVVRLTLPDGNAVTSDQPHLAQILSKALGREVTLVRARGEGELSGATAEEYWPDVEGLDHRDTVTEWELPTGTFFDLAVVHLMTTATIDRLRALYPEGRFEVRRFRPNIVVATDPDEQGFVENDWIGRTVAIGGEVRLRITGPCPRCVMTTLPQGDLPRDAGILRTAAQHNQANVGVYADVIAGGAIRRGDHVTLA
ncbi:MOSC domain-containing protein [Streptomyces sp. NBC_01615]|uniref:MOSC domain-containing protein n=1 Tax=Streptomyces sp. NBC_01615 TaxID=2975898 RepID=UPI00386F240E